MAYREEDKRWWGWGLNSVKPPEAKGFLKHLEEKIGGLPEESLPVPELESLTLRPSIVPEVLNEKLIRAVGVENVKSNDFTRVLHCTGRSYRDLIRIRLGNIPSLPDVVVYPEDHDQVRLILSAASAHHAAVVPFGGGSSVVGGLDLPSDIRPFISLDLTRMNKLLDMDADSLTATFQAGIYGPDLEAVLEKKGFTLGHFPQSFEFSTLGGWIAARGAGNKSIKYGKMEDITMAVRVALPDGELSTPIVPAAAAGGDLCGLLAGSEGSLGVITEAVVKIRPVAENEWQDSFLFPNFASGVEAVRRIMAGGHGPAMIRLSDEDETEALTAEAMSKESGAIKNFIMDNIAPSYLKLKGIQLEKACLMIAAGEGRDQEMKVQKTAVRRICGECGGVRAGAGPARAWHESRYAAPYLRDELISRRIFIETLETAANWSRLTDLYTSVRRALEDVLQQFGVKGLIMTHLSHSYPEGANLYFTITAPQAYGMEEKQWLEIKKAAAQAIVDHGGAISHHHGIGRDHKPWMENYWGKELVDVFRAAKNKLDPLSILNPGALFDMDFYPPHPPEKYSPFSPATRISNIERLEQEIFDVFVIGGGIVGAGSVWDAGLRGLSAALVEKDDFGSGTSGKSSRMIHGGLRYLKMLDIKLVRESLSERRHLIKMAPHLVRPMSHLVPIYKGDGDSQTVMHLGLWGYDTLAGSKGLPPHESLTSAEVMEMEPNIWSDGLEGGLIYYDALTDDARLTLETIKAASRSGAAVGNHLEATGISIGPEYAEISLRDVLTGREFTALSRTVVNASGVWTDRVRSSAIPEAENIIQPAKGIHIVFPLSLKPIKNVVILKGADGRPLFAVPSGDMVYVGTTDDRYEGDLDSPRATTDEVDYLIDAVNRYLIGPPLTREGVTATWAGVRPLVSSGKKDETKDISREHIIMEEQERIVTVCGGKLTTFRVMAAQTIDRVLTILRGEVNPASPTADLPLSGPPQTMRENPVELSPVIEKRLREKYGPQAGTIMSLAKSPRLACVLDEETGLIVAEIHWVVQGEMAMTLCDAMVRRLGLTYMTPDNGAALAPRAAVEMASLLHWDEAEIQNQLQKYQAYLDAELGFKQTGEIESEADQIH